MHVFRQLNSSRKTAFESLKRSENTSVSNLVGWRRTAPYPVQDDLRGQVIRSPAKRERPPFNHFGESKISNLQVSILVQQHILWLRCEDSTMASALHTCVFCSANVVLCTPHINTVFTTCLKILCFRISVIQGGVALRTNKEFHDRSRVLMGLLHL